MKKLLGAVVLVSVIVASQATIVAQEKTEPDSTGLPGDDFSLQGALEMFKNANSPEEFEKLLNTQDNHVNNLDLNGDGETDYVRVIDKTDKGVHALVLQVPVSEKESQDIAVIELEKTGDANAVVQIVGDKDIYGRQTIVEPGDGEDNGGEVKDSGGGRPHFAGSESYNAPPLVVVNVWGWPAVRYVYAPAYVAWVSPWRWRAYPVWWHPWRPLAWHVFRPYRLRYRSGFAVVRTHRVIVAHRIYMPVRRTSGIVRSHHAATVRHYRTTRTIVKGKDVHVREKAARTRVGRKRR